MMGQRRIRHVLIVSLLLAVLWADTGQSENVKVGIPSLTVTTLPLAVARDQGFFHREGLARANKAASIDAALAAASIRDTRQAEGIGREVPINQVFDFSYLEAAR